LRIHKLYQTNWRLLLFIIWMQSETIHRQMLVSSSFRLEKFFIGTARIILNHGTSLDHLALLWKFFEAEDVLFGLCYTLKTVSIQSFLFPNCLRNQMSQNLRSLFHYVNFIHFFDSLIPDETIFFQPFSVSLFFILYHFIYYFYLSRFIFNKFFCFDWMIEYYLRYAIYAATEPIFSNLESYLFFFLVETFGILIQNLESCHLKYL
jgi:hypothetical protein